MIIWGVSTMGRRQYKTGYLQTKNRKNAKTSEEHKKQQLETFKENFGEIADEFTDEEIQIMSETGILDYVFDEYQYAEAEDTLVDRNADMRIAIKRAKSWSAKKEFTQRDLDKLFDRYVGNTDRRKR